MKVQLAYDEEESQDFKVWKNCVQWMTYLKRLENNILEQFPTWGADFVNRESFIGTWWTAPINGGEVWNCASWVVQLPVNGSGAFNCCHMGRDCCCWSHTQVLILDWMEFWRGYPTYSPLLLIRWGASQVLFFF